MSKTYVIYIYIMVYIKKKVVFSLDFDRDRYTAHLALNSKQSLIDTSISINIHQKIN